MNREESSYLRNNSYITCFHVSCKIKNQPLRPDLRDTVRNMRTDVVDLRDFYAGNLGSVARRMVRRQIRTIWPTTKGGRVLGLGFATPYLHSFVEEAERVVAAMPSRQGVIRWPSASPGLTTLVDETDLPFQDLTFDRVLLAHGLEQTEALRPLLREIWRVMAGDGRLLVIAPNRRGLWARFERSPFGHGRPYSHRQLSNQLRDAMFTPMASENALFMPPFRSSVLLSAAPAMERVGRTAFSRFGGVLLMEATKQIYASSDARQPARRAAMAGTAPEIRAEGLNAQPRTGDD